MSPSRRRHTDVGVTALCARAGADHCFATILRVVPV